jgi:hypothetical protein
MRPSTVARRSLTSGGERALSAPRLLGWLPCCKRPCIGGWQLNRGTRNDQPISEVASRNVV